MMIGTYPGRRHDGRPWSPEDPQYALANSSLGYRAVTICIKGDWAEVSCTSILGGLDLGFLLNLVKAYEGL
jgi:hypothetical protein